MFEHWKTLLYRNKVMNCLVGNNYSGRLISTRTRTPGPLYCINDNGQLTCNSLLAQLVTELHSLRAVALPFGP